MGGGKGDSQCEGFEMLTVDILASPPLSAYLCNVLAALGQNPSHQLTQLELLFKADREQ